MPEPPMQAEPLAPKPEEVSRPFHYLYLLSLPDGLRDQFIEAHHLGGVRLRLQDVADAMRGAPVQRVYKLHAVASALMRKPGLADGAGASHLATAIETGDAERPDVEGGLRTFAGRQGTGPEQASGRKLTRPSWQEFLGDVGLEGAVSDQLRLISKPGCNDGETVDTDDGDAALISSRFWTTYGFDEMAKFVEPTKWKECGEPFWADVLEVDKRPAPTSNPRDYDGTYDEIVNLPLTTLRVRLDVKYRMQPGLVRLDYDLSPFDPYGQVTFDSGFLAVTTGTYGDHGETTLVEGSKAIRFTDPLLNQLPDLACDGGWVYMMIDMALNGAGVTEPLRPPPSSEAAPPSFGPITATIDAEIDAWIKQANDSLVSHGASAKRVTRRILARQHDPRWMNDVAGMTHEAIVMTGATIGAWRRILRELGSLGGR
jgi:hypothetical protein